MPARQLLGRLLGKAILVATGSVVGVVGLALFEDQVRLDLIPWVQQKLSSALGSVGFAPHQVLQLYEYYPSKPEQPGELQAEYLVYWNAQRGAGWGYGRFIRRRENGTLDNDKQALLVGTRGHDLHLLTYVSARHSTGRCGSGQVWLRYVRGEPAVYAGVMTGLASNPDDATSQCEPTKFYAVLGTEDQRAKLGQRLEGILGSGAVIDPGAVPKSAVAKP